MAFKRARLQYVYSILRGKDLETEQFSDNCRIEQFEKLKDAQGEISKTSNTGTPSWVVSAWQVFEAGK